MDSWKGIDISRGIIANMIESSYFKTSVINGEEAVQERFNSYVLGGYERNNVLYPYILNLEFMFNDNPSMQEFSMHRYFGVYLTENALVDYDSIIRWHGSGDIIKTALDGSVADDRRAIAAASEQALADRIFFITTNNDAARIQSESDVDEFVSKYVLDNPDKHIGTLRSVEHKWADDEKSFMTMKFTRQISYGEHFRIIARNLSDKSEIKNICIDLIASNDKRLATTDDNISAYIQTSSVDAHIDATGEGIIPTEVYRVSFYTQSLSDETIAAELSEQLKRLSAAIRKSCPFASVESVSDDMLGLVSSHDNVWFQHIEAPNHVRLPEFGYMTVDEVGDDLNVKWGGRQETDREMIDSLVSSLETFTRKKVTQTYIDDIRYSDGHVTAPLKKMNTDRAVAYVEYDADDCAIDDYIRFYNQDVVMKMRPVSPDTWWYSPEFLSFSLYGFESLGWRYSSIVRFINTDAVKVAYDVYDSVEDILSSIRYPLVKAQDGNFYPIPRFQFGCSYLTDNTLLLLGEQQYHTHTQKIVTEDDNALYVMSPSVPGATLLCFGSASDDWRPVTSNYQISIYNPESARISVMGITQFRDFDMFIGEDRTTEVSQNGNITISAGTTLSADSQEDDRLKRNVLYNVISGSFNGYSLRRFIIGGDTLYYVSSDSDKVMSRDFSGTLTATTDVIMGVIDSSDDEFLFMRDIPGQKADNFLKEPSEPEQSSLSISVVPQSNCLWVSNGVYFDRNSVLDVSNLKNEYTPEGFFTNHGYSLVDDGRTSSYSLDSYAKDGSDIKRFRNIIDTRSVIQAIRKMLVSNSHIQTAVGYYNPFVQSLEFIYYGIKFNIKFNSDYYNQNIRIGDYNNFDVYVIDDYNPQKDNEIYISTTEEMILIVNHKFSQGSSGTQQTGVIYDVSAGNLDGGCNYNVGISPYKVFADSICGFAGSMCCRREETSQQNDASSWFVQEDYAIDDMTGNSTILPHYVYFPADATDEENTIVTVDGSSVGILRDNASGFRTVQYSDMSSIDTSNNLTSFIHRQQDSFIVSEKIETEKDQSDSAELLDEYIESMSGNFMCYVISQDSTEEFLITDEYKPIVLMMSRPKRIKYNFGYFMPRTYEITHFAVEDYEVADRCGISLFLSGTKLESLDKLNSYTGNMVIPETATGPIARNYFIMDERSVMSSNWDAKYYRSYSQDGTYKLIDGYVPGIEDKSFVGSRCMIIQSDYILLDDFSAVRIAAHTDRVSSAYNTQSKNTIQCKMTINISQAIYDLFEKSSVFRDNWSTISGDVQTSISNYIKNSISKIYNRQRKREVELLALRDPELETMDVVFQKPLDESEWEKIDDYDAEMTVGQNDEMILVITMTERAGIKVHPRVKIFRYFK